MASAEENFIRCLESDDPFSNIHALSTLYPPGSLMFQGRLKVKSKHGLVRRWKTRFIDLRFPTDLRLAENRLLKNPEKFSIVNYKEVKVQPLPMKEKVNKKYLKINLVSIHSDMDIKLRCTSKTQFRNLRAVLIAMLDMGTFQRQQIQRVLENMAANNARNHDVELDRHHESATTKESGDDMPDSSQTHLLAAMTLPEKSPTPENDQPEDENITASPICLGSTQETATTGETSSEDLVEETAQSTILGRQSVDSQALPFGDITVPSQKIASEEESVPEPVKDGDHYLSINDALADVDVMETDHYDTLLIEDIVSYASDPDVENKDNKDSNEDGCSSGISTRFWRMLETIRRFFRK